MKRGEQGWTQTSYEAYLEELAALGEASYGAFNARLIPGVTDMLGVRVPVLRRCAQEIARGDWRSFLEQSRSSIHEAVVLEGLVLGYARCEYREFCQRIRSFAEKVSNWAQCDIPVSSFRNIRKFREAYLSETDWMLNHENPWVCRVGLVVLLDHYLEDSWVSAALRKAAGVHSDFYYVQMAQGWLIATAWAKNREETVSCLPELAFSGEVCRIAAQKIRDSFRISPEDKALAPKLLTGKGC